MNRDLGGITLTSISSYIGGRFLNLVDGDGTIAPLLHIDFGSKTEEYSQDLRLSTNGSGRSEEHTSELQSLMRISYAVFCLKNKKDTNQQYNYTKHTTTPTD